MRRFAWYRILVLDRERRSRTESRRKWVSGERARAWGPWGLWACGGGTDCHPGSPRRLFTRECLCWGMGVTVFPCSSQVKSLHKQQRTDNLVVREAYRYYGKPIEGALEASSG